MQAAIEREKRASHERAWLAWHTAALSRCKKMPKLSDLLPKEKKKAQTVAAMEAAARQWHSVVHR